MQVLFLHTDKFAVSRPFSCRQAFEMMDSDADGFITFGEFKNAMKVSEAKHSPKLNTHRPNVCQN